jgi:hypothetical protein
MGGSLSSFNLGTARWPWIVGRRAFRVWMDFVFGDDSARGAARALARSGSVSASAPAPTLRPSRLRSSDRDRLC